jgi:hypothetical protein
MENENLLEVESGCCCSQPPSLAGSYSYHLCDSCKVHDGGGNSGSRSNSFVTQIIAQCGWVEICSTFSGSSTNKILFGNAKI